MAVLCLKNKFFIVICIVCGVFSNLNAAASDIQNQIITLSTQIRDNEITLDNLIQYKKSLNQRQADNEQILSSYARELSELVVYLYKINNIPSEVLLFDFNSYQDILLSYALFNYYKEYLSLKIDEIYNNIYLIQQNKKELSEVEDKINNINKTIKDNIKILKELVKYSDINKAEMMDINKKNKYLIEQSDNLFSLMVSISKTYNYSSGVDDNVFIKNKGKFILPVVGYLDTKFHQGVKEHIFYNGISILAEPNSQIVAPFDGEVLFVNNVQNYGNLIIIKHSKSYYTIISGDFESLVLPTQLVKKNEAIGISGNKLLPIYFELQHNVSPIDPALWLIEIDKKRIS